MKILIAFLFILFPCLANATTYYSSTGGSGTTCSIGTPCSMTSGIAKVVAGDTLLLNDGTYTSSLSSIPNGSAGNYITIKAINDGNVTITGGLALLHTDAYIQVEGINFSDSSNKIVVGNHIKFMRCGFFGAESSGNHATLSIGTYDFTDTQYILIEDCWVAGIGGRYKVLVYNSDRVVLRRIVARDDGGWTDGSDDPEAGVVVYHSSNVSLQNVIVINSNLSTYDNNNTAAFYHTGHYELGPSDNTEYLGCMAIDNKLWGLSADTDDGANAMTIRNMVIWGQGDGIIAQSNHSAVLNVYTSTFGAAPVGFGNWGQYSTTISGFPVVAVPGTLASGDVTLSNYSQYTTTALAKTAGLWYLPRIESGSTLATAGRGATVLKKYGTSGTLHGEAGYNTLTAANLWPWPNEARIKADFAAVPSVGARGFATGNSMDATPQTLTKYIWEYLGNQIPSEVYGGESDITNPVVTITGPTSSATHSTSSTSGSYSGTCTDDVAVASVAWTCPTCTPTSGTATGTTSWSFSNTLASGANTITVTCTDTSANTHQDSLVDTYTPVSGSAGKTISGGASFRSGGGSFR